MTKEELIQHATTAWPDYVPPPVAPTEDSRVAKLVSQFDGAIKYEPMIKDHQDWSDDQCLELARRWHAVAIVQLREAMQNDRDRAVIGSHWHDPPEGNNSWNHGIPYCRNLPTTAMFDEVYGK